MGKLIFLAGLGRGAREVQNRWKNSQLLTPPKMLRSHLERGPAEFKELKFERVQRARLDLEGLSVTVTFK